MMLKKKSALSALFTTLLLAGVSTAYADEGNCMPIGGVAIANFVAQNDGTTTIVAALSGSVEATSGKIVAQRETKTGLEMDMEHYFMNDKGGFIHTKDLGILTRVEGQKDRYMIEITYDVQEGNSRGVLKGYKGTFNSYGLVDLKNMEGQVRYSGKICK